MTKTLNILILAAQAGLSIKVGKPADVTDSLAYALHTLNARQTGGCKLDVRLVLPFHSFTQTETVTSRSNIEFTIDRRSGSITAQALEQKFDGLPVYFIKGKPIHSPASIYTFDSSKEQEKFTFFSIAALELVRRLNWKPDIIHANDWHTALALYALRSYRKDLFFIHTKGLITIQDLSNTGGDASDVLASYNLTSLKEKVIPKWARSHPLPLGVWAADAIVPISQTYACEIQTPDFGCDFHNFLQMRANQITGILNGIDITHWNPQNDHYLVAKFKSASLGMRAVNKMALQKKLGLPVDSSIPLLGMVTRIDPKQGLDLALDALRLIADKPWQFVLLGMGDRKLELAASEFEREFIDRARVVIRYDALIERLIFGGGDILLMPSRFEPGGLEQMIALRYGCVPIVRATGGLKDTVHEGKTGFLFEKAEPKELVRALGRALSTYSKPEQWKRLQRNGMKENYSWLQTACQYSALYLSLVSRKETSIKH